LPRFARTFTVAAMLVAASAHAAEPLPGLPDDAPPAAPDWAEPRWELDASIPVGFLSGSTSYRISLSDGSSSVASELDFPLRGVVAGLHARAASPAAPGTSRWVLEASALHSLGAMSGTVEDSDWVDGPAEVQEVGANHAGKDIYSTSTGALTALLLEARVGRSVALAPDVRLVPLVGFLYQRFSYDVSDVHQQGYGPWNTSAFTGSASGTVLTYEVSQRALYVGVRGEVASGRWSAALEGWASPVASASDEDDHVLRHKISKTEASGRAWQLGAEGRVLLGPADDLSVRATMVQFDLSGTQHQEMPATAPYTGTVSIDVPAEIHSTRFTGLVAWTHRFR
jgi:outer membrane protease